MKYFPLIWSGIWRKRGRTVLTALQVLIAFALFGVMQGMSSGLDNMIDKISADLLQVSSRVGAGDPLPLSYLNRIQNLAGVKAVSYSNLLTATYQRPNQQLFLIAATMPDWLATNDGIVIDAKQVEAFETNRTGAIVGRALMEKHRWKIGDRIPLSSSVLHADGSNTWTFDIVGIFDNRDDPKATQFLLINNSYFDEARMSQKGTVMTFTVKVTDPRQAARMSLAIDELFKNSANETRTQPEKQLVQQQMRSMGNVEFIVRTVTSAVFFALLLSISASMMQTFRQRLPELAVLKTLGFTDAAVFTLLIIEALAVWVAAALLGLALAYQLILLAASTLSIGVSMPIDVLAVGAGLAVALALLSVSLPAWRGLKLQVVDALASR